MGGEGFAIGTGSPSSGVGPLKNDPDFRAHRDALTQELVGGISLRPSPQACSLEGADFTAYILARGGFLTLASIELSLALNRKYFLHGMRGENLSRRDLLFLLEILEISRRPPRTGMRNAPN